VYFDLIQDFPIVSIEDPFAEEDWQAFSNFTKQAKPKITIVGDDLLTTNPARIVKGVLASSCNALLLKPNQIGTITETLDAAALARAANWKVIASHRSGDSEDTFLADLSVGLGCQAAKIGAPCRGERTSKYNRLLFIEKFHKVKLAKWV
ncbi:MAG: enolase C-terminal domain-like protein, partial [Candidatus Micrarchaeota archaeon]